MGRKLVQETNLQNIAAAIRTKNGSSSTYKPREMADAIRALPSSSTLVPKAITENGSYSPQSENADGYSSVTVNVGRYLGDKSITRNGTFRAASDHVDGYSSVSVNVPNSYSALDEGKVVSSGTLTPQTSLSVTQNGTFDTTRNNQVTVNVSGGGAAESPTLVPKTITENGTYLPADDNADGFNWVNVAVPGGFEASDEGKVVQNGALMPQTGLEVSANGTYDTTAKNSVVVNVGGGNNIGAITEAWNDLYVMSTADSLICTLSSRSFTKKYSDQALVVYCCKIGSDGYPYTAPFLVSETADGVVYISSLDQTEFSSMGTVSFHGKTYYYAGSCHGMQGNHTSSGGAARKLTKVFSATDSLESIALYVLNLAVTTEITQNGSYSIPAGYAGSGSILVQVPNQTMESLSSLSEAHGGVWIDSEIDVSLYTHFLFLRTENSTILAANSIDTANIAVYSGGSDVYTTVFAASPAFNVRIYNGTLWISYNGTGFGSKTVYVINGVY